MACSQCVERPVRDALCARCFSRRVQKRIKAALRGTLDEKDVVVFLQVADRRAEAVVLEHVMRSVLGASHRQIVVGATRPSVPHRLVLPDTVDDVLVRALDHVARTGSAPADAGAIMPLSRISRGECELVASDLGLEFEVMRSNSFPGIDQIEEKYPGTKATLAKALGLF